MSDMNAFQVFRKVKEDTVDRLRELLKLLAKDISQASTCLPDGVLENYFRTKPARVEIYCFYDQENDELIFSKRSVPGTENDFGKVKLTENDFVSHLNQLDEFMKVNYPGIHLDTDPNREITLYMDKETVQFQFVLEADLTPEDFEIRYGYWYLKKEFEYKNTEDIALRFAADLMKVQVPELKLADTYPTNAPTLANPEYYKIEDSRTDCYGYADFFVEVSVDVPDDDDSEN